MGKLLRKECRLAASPLSWFFLIGTLLALVPGYPILMGAFFTTLGIFYSFQSTRENNDIFYSLLLPVSKGDVVKGKYAFSVLIEMIGFFIMAVIAILRMSFFRDAPVYTGNALMCANLVFLGFALLIFGLFNFCFIRGFFKTAYYFGKPFIGYCVAALLVTAIAETLHHIPGLETLNSLGWENMGVQLPALGIGIMSYLLLTWLGFRLSVKSFRKTDL